MRVVGAPFASSKGLEPPEIDHGQTPRHRRTLEADRALAPPHKPRRRRFPGRKPIDDRKALTGILFVLKTGINWEDLPRKMGCGCGMTCWKEAPRLERGRVWQKLHERLLAEFARGGPDRLGIGR